MARKRNRFLKEALEAQQADIAVEDIDTEEPWISRSQKKRNSTALQKLGEELVALPPSNLKKLPLSDDLREALQLMARITNHEGRRRQMQYIGKLMREVNVEPLRDALDHMRQGHNKETALLHHAERLREALLHANATERTKLLQPFAEEKEELVMLIERAKQETAPHAKRALFKKLYTLFANTAKFQ